MRKKEAYPLNQVIDVKIRRVEEAERFLAEKRRILTVEQENLKKAEVARDKVKDHRIAKLQQLRDELDSGTTSDKVQQMKVYLKTVDEKLKIEEKKVKDQKVKVEAAQKEVDEAKRQLNIKRQEVDKLQTHKISWEKEKKKELELLEEKEMDEIGQIVHGLHRRKY